MKMQNIIFLKKPSLNLYTRLVLLVILLIIQLQGGPFDLTLACGLFGFIGTEPQTYFSWDKFNILGIYNDSRGGDACGRVFGNEVQHGIGTLETYKKFIEKVPIPKLTTYPTTILGHCRKASSGGFKEIYSQPIVLRKGDINMKSIRDTHLKKAIRALDDEAIVFSGVHNGTIDNYKDLAPKYGIPIEDHNDTKVLLSALFYGNFEVLSLYRGTAALMWHNHITNKTFIFKGESKVSAHASGVNIEERPLFFYKIAPNNFYLSSMPESLAAIGADETEICNLAPNIITVFKDGKKITQFTIDRSKAHQAKYEAPSTYKKYDSYYGKNNRNDLMHRDGYPLWERFRDEVETEEIESKALGKIITSINSQIAPYKGPLSPKHVVTGEGATNPFVRLFEERTESFRLQAEIAEPFGSRSTRRTCYNKGRYWMNGALMHGVYLLNTAGIVPTALTANAAVVKPYYFVEGIMLDGVHGYNKAMTVHAEFMVLTLGTITALVDNEQELTRAIVKYSKWPTVSLTSLIGEQDCLSHLSSESTFYEGMFTPLFSDREYMFDKGDLLNIRTRKDGLRLSMHDEKDMAQTAAYIKSCAEDASKDNNYKMGIRLIQDGLFSNPLSPFQNLVFAFFGIGESPEIELMLLHYLRDFRLDLREECEKCPALKCRTRLACLKCQSVKDELVSLATEIDYEVFKY